MAIFGNQAGTMIDDGFLENVRNGLNATQKYLSSKYFYDAAGSAIFQEIMAMPEYYLTQAEFEILTAQAQTIGNDLQLRQPFQVIELGAGDGKKTLEMLARWQAIGLQFQYVPIDVSAEALQDLQANANRMGLVINMLPCVGDYFEVLNQISFQGDRLFLFLGANIGNYEREYCRQLLAQIRCRMRGADQLMIGFDLQKESAVVEAAYDDPHGITKRFNINLLLRINRELGGTFLTDQFDFKCIYNPENGELKSYLISLQAQSVWIEKLGSTIRFEQGEEIHTELSKKYSLQEIQALAISAGFIVKRNYSDSAQYFVDSMWGLRNDASSEA